jgi:hypothetical protein
MGSSFPRALRWPAGRPRLLWLVDFLPHLISFCPGLIDLLTDGIGETQEYVRNTRGVQLFTCGWLPAAASPKALIFLDASTRRWSLRVADEQT